MCLVTPARLASRRTIRVAAWRSSRRPDRLSSSGPAVRSSAAASTARATPRRERDDSEFVALAEDRDGAVASFGLEVLDVDGAGLAYPQSKQPEQTRQRVVDGAGCGGLGDEGAEFHAVQAEGVRLSGDVGPANVVGGVAVKSPVDHREAVHAGDS
ncbi:MAG: hypothetical protein ACRDJN_24505 [Chloroflexota bacterium]